MLGVVLLMGQCAVLNDIAAKEKAKDVSNVYWLVWLLLFVFGSTIVVRTLNNFGRANTTAGSLARRLKTEVDNCAPCKADPVAFRREVVKELRAAADEIEAAARMEYWKNKTSVEITVGTDGAERNS